MVLMMRRKSQIQNLKKQTNHNIETKKSQNMNNVFGAWSFLFVICLELVILYLVFAHRA